MKVVSDLETYLVKVSKGLPHLPKKVLDWLYENVWWIVAAGVGLSVLGALSSLHWFSLFLADINAIFGYGYRFGFDGFFTILGSLGWAVIMIAAIVASALAIMPLKEKKKRGWDLLFMSSLISAVGAILSALLSGWALLSNLFGAAIGLAIGWYFLFELRGHYAAKTDTSSPKKSAAADK